MTENIYLAIIGGLFGGGSVILAIIKIFEARQLAKNKIAIASEEELAKIRSELWNRIVSLECEMRAMREQYERDLASLRVEIDKWQAKYYQVLAVPEHQTKIIEALQAQVDKMEATAYGGHSPTAPNG
jgi:hypothetical protein